MWPRLSRRGWFAQPGHRVGLRCMLQCGRGSRAADGRARAPCPTQDRGFNVAAALAPRMAMERGLSGGRLHAASMWPRLSRRGWDASIRGRDPSLRSLQCGRGSRAADGAGSWSTRSCGVSCFNVAAALAPRMGDDQWRGRQEPAAGFNVAAALAPRMAKHLAKEKRAMKALQCGRGSRAADGGSAAGCATRARTSFNVAAALAPRMDSRSSRFTSARPFSLQCGRGSRAADGGSRRPPPPGVRDASMWPRLSRRGWRSSTIWRP